MTATYQQHTLFGGVAPVSDTREVGSGFIVLMVVAGFVSGLLTDACILSPGRSGLFLGGVLGLVIGSCLIAFRVFLLWQAICFFVIATAAYVFALCTSIAVQWVLPTRLLLISPDERWSLGHPETVSPVALFVGGLVGAFPLLAAVCLLARRRLRIDAFALKCALWAVWGGGLAVLGWALQGSLGSLIWHLFYIFRLTDWSRSPHDELGGLGHVGAVYSIHLVWQTGIAIALGVILRRYQAESLSKGTPFYRRVEALARFTTGHSTQ
jgi:hypothetical protein